MGIMTTRSLYQINDNNFTSVDKKDFSIKNHSFEIVPSFALSIRYKPEIIFAFNEISKGEDLLNYQPKTELGKRLWKLKLEYIISGGKLLDYK